jgi:hypothetical protein
MRDLTMVRTEKQEKNNPNSDGYRQPVFILRV